MAAKAKKLYASRMRAGETKADYKKRMYKSGDHPATVPKSYWEQNGVKVAQDLHSSRRGWTNLGA